MFSTTVTVKDVKVFALLLLAAASKCRFGAIKYVPD
jgi:hypothetical protein